MFIGVALFKCHNVIVKRVVAGQETAGQAKLRLRLAASRPTTADIGPTFSKDESYILAFESDVAEQQ